MCVPTQSSGFLAVLLAMGHVDSAHPIPVRPVATASLHMAPRTAERTYPGPSTLAMGIFNQDPFQQAECVSLENAGVLVGWAGGTVETFEIVESN